MANYMKKKPIKVSKEFKKTVKDFIADAPIETISSIKETFAEIKKEQVNSPDHYQSGKMEVIDVIEAFDLNFSEGNILKYLLRYKKKNGIIDLKKSQWYLNRIINKIEKETV